MTFEFNKLAVSVCSYSFSPCPSVCLSFITATLHFSHRDTHSLFLKKTLGKTQKAVQQLCCSEGISTILKDSSIDQGKKIFSTLYFKTPFSNVPLSLISTEMVAVNDIYPHFPSIHPLSFTGLQGVQPGQVAGSSQG